VVAPYFHWTLTERKGLLQSYGLLHAIEAAGKLLRRHLRLCGISIAVARLYLDHGSSLSCRLDQFLHLTLLSLFGQKKVARKVITPLLRLKLSKVAPLLRVVLQALGILMVGLLSNLKMAA